MLAGRPGAFGRPVLLTRAIEIGVTKEEKDDKDRQDTEEKEVVKNNLKINNKKKPHLVLENHQVKALVVELLEQL